MIVVKVFILTDSRNRRCGTPCRVLEGRSGLFRRRRRVLAGEAVQGRPSSLGMASYSYFSRIWGFRDGLYFFDN